MTESSQTARLGSFALVSYIPEPLRSLLHAFRDTLPGDENPQPHITVLPPRALSVPVEAATAQCRDVLTDVSEFKVTLGSVRRFPSTNVLYLDLWQGNSQIHRLHDALSTGQLDQQEEFDFRPHLTLSGFINSDDLPALERQAHESWTNVGLSKTFVLREIVGLWLSPEAGWQRLWSQQLRSGARAASAGVPRGL